MISVRAAWRSDVGQQRERNEDSCFAGDHVFAVADGLGGHRAGEVASRVALGSVAALDGLDAHAAARRIGDAVRASNREVFDRAQDDASLKGMGTTMTALAIDGPRAHLAHVGDSRCYLVRRGRIEQVSRDHTLVARMVAEGRLTLEQAETHPQRSVLTRALGADRDVDVEEVELDLAPGDRLVLCSDGLSGMLTDEEIARLVQHGDDLDEICVSLIDEANARGGPDNITAVVVAIGGTLPAGTPKPPRARGRDRRRTPVRALVWALLVAAVAGGGFFGVRAWANRSYYVGIDGGQVAVFRGLPVDVLGWRLSHMEEPTGIAEEDVAAWYRPRLTEGIRAATLAEARRIVTEQVPVETPQPSASPEPSAEAP